MKKRLKQINTLCFANLKQNILTYEQIQEGTIHLVQPQPLKTWNSLEDDFNPYLELESLFNLKFTVNWMQDSEVKPSWRLQNVSQFGSFPPNRDEHNNYLKPASRNLFKFPHCNCFDISMVETLSPCCVLQNINQ